MFKVLFSSTSKDSSILLFGTILSSAINVLITILLTRYLSTSEFGLIITGLTVISLLTDFFELGINPGLVHFLPNSLGQERLKIIKVTLFIKIFIGVVIASILALFATQLAVLFFHGEGMATTLKISGVGILLLMLIFWGQAVFQAERKFLWAMITNTSINVLRIMVVLLLIFLGNTSQTSFYFGLQIVLIFSVLLVFLQLRESFMEVKIRVEDYKKVLKFGLPIGLSFALAALYTRLDQLIIFNIAGPTEAGIYGLASRINIFFVFAVAALNSAIAVRFSSIAEGDFMSYFRKTVFASFGLVALIVISAAVAPQIIPLVFGPKFIASVMPFQLLALGSIFFALAGPFFSAILYKYKKNKYSLVVSIAALVLTWILLGQFVPAQRSVGGALAMAIVYFSQLTASVSYFSYLQSKK